MQGIKITAVGVLTISLVTGCLFQSTSTTNSPMPTLSPINSSSGEYADFNQTAKLTIEALKAKDLKTLSEIVHPMKGVQVSPYGHIDMVHDLTIGSDELVDLLDDLTITNWGDYDGSGLPIELTFKDYYEKLIYSHDFANAPKISVNEAIGKGNLINNLFESYPKDKYKTIEYHFDKVDPENNGLDWVSLKLVFEPVEGEWKLVAIVHDQWTI